MDAPGYVGMKNAHREICGYDYYHLLGGAHIKEELEEKLDRSRKFLRSE